MKPKTVEYQNIENLYDHYSGRSYTHIVVRTRLETNEEIQERNMSRRTFRLLKDTDFLKAGTVVQEDCDDGDQPYSVLDFEDAIKFDDFDDYNLSSHQLSRGAVEDNPEWYEEVELTWVTKVKQAVTRARKGKK